MDANGGVNFDEMSKYPLAELQVNTEDLPSGVDPKCKEVRNINLFMSFSNLKLFCLS
jgi:hypothetical protein